MVRIYYKISLVEGKDFKSVEIIIISKRLSFTTVN